MVYINRSKWRMILQNANANAKALDEDKARVLLLTRGSLRGACETRGSVFDPMFEEMGHGVWKEERAYSESLNSEYSSSPTLMGLPPYCND